MPDKTLKMNNGMVSFSELTERWQYDFCLLPMNKDGIFRKLFDKERYIETTKNTFTLGDLCALLLITS